jgi:hypothetical protein
MGHEAGLDDGEKERLVIRNVTVLTASWQEKAELPLHLEKGFPHNHAGMLPVDPMHAKVICAYRLVICSSLEWFRHQLALTLTKYVATGRRSEW